MAIPKGTQVAADVRAFRGADPMTRYVVTDVHRDQTHDLATADDPKRVVARRVAGKHLEVLKA